MILHDDSAKAGGLMAMEPLYVQLTWEDADTGITQQSLLQPPIALGRDGAYLPNDLDDQPVSQLQLPHRQVSRYHALITVGNQQLFLTDRSANGSYLNGQPVRGERVSFTHGDTLRIGPFKITATVVNPSDMETTESTHLNALNAPSVEASKPMLQKTALIWGVGMVILVGMAVGVWWIVGYALQRVRPQTPTSPRSQQGRSSAALIRQHPGSDRWEPGAIVIRPGHDGRIKVGGE